MGFNLVWLGSIQQKLQSATRTAPQLLSSKCAHCIIINAPLPTLTTFFRCESSKEPEKQFANPSKVCKSTQTPVHWQGKDCLNSISGSASFKGKAGNMVEIATRAEDPQNWKPAQKTNFCTHTKWTQEFNRQKRGATDWTRTSTALLPTGPKPVASTNFATVARFNSLF